MPTFPKPRPAKLERQDRRRARQSADEAENVKVRARSRGYCELMTSAKWRCNRPARHIHHKIGGWGKRARGVSILAVNKLHLCPGCHADVHAHVLVPDGAYFRRVR